MRSDAVRALGVDGETGRPLAPLCAQKIRQQMRARHWTPKPMPYGVPSHDLATAGWGLVIPEEADRAVREALEPLLKVRRRQAGDLYRELTYRIDEDALRFRRRLRAPHGPVEPRQLPWYLLLVGSPEELPHGFEMDLDVPCAVGRLAFDDLDDLAAYAERAAALDSPSGAGRGGLVFAPSHPDDPPTAVTSEYFARPLEVLLSSRGLSVGSAIGRGASRARLLDLLGQERDFWIFAGHGVQYRPGHVMQRSHQGALLCADWPGPKQWPEGSPLDHLVTAADLPDGVLSGGIALLFGCHTAGTSSFDFYESVDPSKARRTAPLPFTSALAQRLLGRRGGALAVIGHVGLAFEAAVYWHGISQIAPFKGALQALLDGRRLGEALEGFSHRFADLSTSWMRIQLTSRAENFDLLDLWIACHDALSWCLLGDPAVRLVRGGRS